MFVAAHLIRPLDVAGAGHSDSTEFTDNDKVEVLYKGKTFTDSQKRQSLT